MSLPLQSPEFYISGFCVFVVAIFLLLRARGLKEKREIDEFTSQGVPVPYPQPGLDGEGFPAGANLRCWKMPLAGGESCILVLSFYRQFIGSNQRVESWVGIILPGTFDERLVEAWAHLHGVTFQFRSETQSVAFIWRAPHRVRNLKRCLSLAEECLLAARVKALPLSREWMINHSPPEVWSPVLVIRATHDGLHFSREVNHDEREPAVDLEQSSADFCAKGPPLPVQCYLKAEDITAIRQWFDQVS